MSVASHLSGDPPSGSVRDTSARTTTVTDRRSHDSTGVWSNTRTDESLLCFCMNCSFVCWLISACSDTTLPVFRKKNDMDCCPIWEIPNTCTVYQYNTSSGDAELKRTRPNICQQRRRGLRISRFVRTQWCIKWIKACKWDPRQMVMPKHLFCCRQL